MSYNIHVIPPFEKQLKRLSKKYNSLKDEFAEFIDKLEENPFQGTSIANSCYKIRFSIKSKGKGKSGGARIITHVVISQQDVYLLAIYDKSEKDNLSNKELKELLSSIT
jgi:mRNA-degrading endonuclease RelE of RelBE toxin-antitoxin system